MHSLRRVARTIGRDSTHPNTWKALLFTHAGEISLRSPDKVLSPIWLYADSDTPVSLV
jgi:hypothetical protein